MRFDYGTQISPLPIKLSIGTLRKPTLREISDITFEKFNFFEVLLKIEPKIYYEKISIDNSFWNSLSDEEKETVTMYQVVTNDERMRNIYLDIFNFFFEDKVIYKEGFFVLLNKDAEDKENLSLEIIHGVIQEKTFSQVVYLIQQICCINNADSEPIENLKFKNEKARKSYIKMQNAQREKENKKKNKEKVDVNLTIPNIISSVSNRHPSLNIINIWDLTIFQLFDSFIRLQTNSVGDIDSTHVSVWGDEKKTYDAAFWYRNIYDKKIQSI